MEFLFCRCNDFDQARSIGLQFQFDFIPLKIDKTGKWILPEISVMDIRNELHEKLTIPKINETELFSYLIENVDVVFPLLHGTYGEDGTIQGFF